MSAGESPVHGGGGAGKAAVQAPRLVVGIGASAGGLEALEKFFFHLSDATSPTHVITLPTASAPPNVANAPKASGECGLAFVVVQHLAPQHASMLVQLLGRRTSMRVVEAQDGMAAEADHVYVIAPGTALSISGGCFKVQAVESERRGLIDGLLRALATDQRERAVGIILSGSGSDGTDGLQAIQEHGGFTMAQDPETAGYDAMPRAAIAAGVVHAVLPAEQMPAKLLQHARDLAAGSAPLAPGSPRQIGTAASAAVLAAFPLDQMPSDAELGAAFDPICALLQSKTGHDFSHYKRGTVLRRLRRRVQLSHAASLDEYLTLLRTDPQEPDRLAQDLFIGVTAFFRDPTAFEYLGAHVLSQLLAAGREHEGMRIWVPGCATGEEAYSIGILLHERLAKISDPPSVQIFATDIDAEAIAEARHGRYPREVADQISPARLARYFKRDGTSLLVTKEVREMCIFSEHSLIRDPPFANLDLISCRNVLIYLDTELQKRLVPLFHYALRRGGFLFLGSAEALASHPEIFDVVDKRLRIFKRRDSVSLPLTDLLAVARAPRRVLPAGHHVKAGLPTQHQLINAAFERLMLQEYAPAGAVVTAEGDVICVAGQTGRYLQPPAGILTTNVLDITNTSLRVELRTALHAAVRSGAEVVKHSVQILVDGAMRRLRLTVRPLPGIKEEKLFVLIFDERLGGAGSAVSEVVSGAAPLSGQERDLTVEQLENELSAIRLELKTTVEELETANEELKASNEELLATNEELQSTNEELSSLNEELSTVNAELSRKADELGQANSDLANFFASTEVATLFVDRALRIQRFTPAAQALLRLIAGDVGRPLGDLAHRFADHDLGAAVGDVLRTQEPSERQVETLDHQHWYLLRVLPYQAESQALAGAVVTLADITPIKRVEAELRQAKEYAEHIIESLPEPLLVLTPDLVVRSANAAFYEHFKVEPGQTAGRKIYDLGNGQWNIPSLRQLLEQVLPQNNVFSGYEMDYVFQELGRRVMLLNGRRLEQMHLILLGISDVTERKLAQQALEGANQRLRQADKQKNEFLATLSHELRNPLAPIRNSLYILDRVAQGGEQARRAQAVIERQVGHLARLVDDLLDVSRITRGKVVLQSERLNLCSLVQQVVEDHRGSFAEAAIALELELPTPAGAVWVSGDPTRLAQAVGNLLTNAVKFTPRGGNTAVAVWGDAARGGACVRVQDSGRGIAPELLPRLFEAFTQLDVTLDRQKGGLGLGLFLVKGLVEMHGGTVRVESDGRGKGAMFTICLPLVE